MFPAPCGNSNVSSPPKSREFSSDQLHRFRLLSHIAGSEAGTEKYLKIHCYAH